MILGLFYKEKTVKREKYSDIERQKSLYVGSKKGSIVDKDVEVNLMADLSDCLDKYKMYKMEQLWEATNGFDEECLIQGSVYKGTIDGEVLAIKKMKWNAREELKILQKVKKKRHVKFSIYTYPLENFFVYYYPSSQFM